MIPNYEFAFFIHNVKNRIKMSLKKLTLTHYIFFGFFLGIAAGWIFGEGILPIAEPLAEIFLRLLRMAIMPLIITSIISAVVSVGNLGRLGLKTFGYYIVSSLMAILTGISTDYKLKDKEIAELYNWLTLHENLHHLHPFAGTVKLLNRCLEDGISR